MKLNENWLREWVNPQLTTSELCEQLTMLGLEVDGVELVAPPFSGVVVGEVVECESHPDADKLQITKVNIGKSELLNIVCGAKNCRKGLKVACAVDGAILPNDFKIKKTKLRGEPSEGMLCSLRELGIDDDFDGIVELPTDAPVGKDIREYLDLDDQIIEISLTPNRADCLSIMGVARDLAVLNNLSLQEPQTPRLNSTLSDKIAIEVEAPEACPRYAGRLIKNIDITKKSPRWMQEKLRRCGIRSIDAVVDVTNYIMMEYGQPMHAFDWDQIKSPLKVRMAKNGEKLTLLDGNEVVLADNTLVIADSEKVLAMAGIFGGQNSAVNSNTKNVLLESAFFAPLAITGRARQYGLHTESSHRFERGVDFNLAETMLKKASALLIEICGGEASEIVMQNSEGYLPKLNSINLTSYKLEQILGCTIPAEKVSKILKGLGFQVLENNNGWTVTPSSWRFDMAIEEDLIEEVARIYGYNNLPNHAPISHLHLEPHPERDLNLNRICTAFVDSDYQEIITYSFVDPNTQKLLFPEQEALILPNPISTEMSAMRLSLFTGLLNTVIYNQNRQQSRIRCFETGLCFVPDPQAENGIRQSLRIGAVIVGERFPQHWQQKSANVDFFDLKGDVMRILSLSAKGKNLEFVAKVYPALHNGQSSSIMLDGKEIGYMGTLHPKIAQNLGITGKPILMEIEWDTINTKTIPSANAISKFPANKRDIAIVVDNSVPASEILSACQQAGGVELVNVALFDVYSGENIDPGKKSLAISLTIQNSSKTLLEEDINAVVNRVLAKLESQFNAYLRS